MARSSTTCLQVSLADNFGLNRHLTMYYSGICRILLWAVPLWLAYWSVPCTEGSWNKLLALGSNSSYLNTMPNFQQCPCCPLYNGHLRGCCNSRPYIDDWLLVHQTRDSTPPMYLVLCPRLGRYYWLLYLDGYLETSRGFNSGTLGANFLHSRWCHLSMGICHLLSAPRYSVKCTLLQRARTHHCRQKSCWQRDRYQEQGFQHQASHTGFC